MNACIRSTGMLTLCAALGCGGDDGSLEGLLDVVDPEGERTGTCLYLTELEEEGEADLAIHYNSVELSLDGRAEDETCILFVVRIDGEPYWISGPDVEVELAGEVIRQSVTTVETVATSGSFDLRVFDLDADVAVEPRFEGTIDVRDVNANRVMVIVRER